MTNPTSDLDHYVDAKIASGEFGFREEFFRETARIYRELEERFADLKSLLRERIDERTRGSLHGSTLMPLRRNSPRNSMRSDNQSNVPGCPHDKRSKRPKGNWSLHRSTKPKS